MRRSRIGTTRPLRPRAYLLVVLSAAFVPNELPPYLILCAIAFAAGHLAPTIGNNVEQLTIGHFYNAARIPPVVQVQLHLLGQVALAVAILSMAHAAMIAVQFFCLLQSFWRGFYGIYLGYSFGRNWFWYRFCCRWFAILLRKADTETEQDNQSE